MSNFVLTGEGPVDVHAQPDRKHGQPVVCYGPCPTCGEPVLTGITRKGERLVLEDVHRPTWCIIQEEPGKLPVLVQSAGIPVHECRI